MLGFKKIRVIASLSILMALFGCNYSHIKGQQDDALGDLSACGPIDYASVNEKVLFVRCVGCHNVQHAEKGIILDSFASVKTNIVKVQEQVESNTMPQGKPLNIDEKQFLLAWIAQGAPETTEEPSVKSCNNVNSPVPPPEVVEGVEPSFNSIKKNIFAFEQTCTGCHGNRAPSGKAKYDFTSFARVITYTNLFDVKNPRESRFVKVLLSGEMPAIGDPLTPEQIDVIVDWISKGLPEETGGPAVLVATEPVTPPTVVLPTVPPPVIPPTPTVPVTKAPLCSDLVDFRDVNAEVFEPVCLRCHGFATLPEFDSYNNVRQNLIKLTSMVRLDKMPPKKPLDTHLKDLLFKWIKNGTPETVDKTGCDPATVPTLVTSPASVNSPLNKEFR